MGSNILKLALSAAAIAAVPGVAQAGTATATSTATFNVVNQCSVTGATVNLGTFKVGTLNDQIGAEVGQVAGGTLTLGSKGAEGIEWGSVTCTSGTPYSLTIKGSNVDPNGPQAIRILIGAGRWVFDVMVKKIGTTVMADDAGKAGGGKTVNLDASAASAVGTGAVQKILGSAPLNRSSVNLASDAGLGAVGTYTDVLTYTLNF